ncbi:hypothetical protein UlMin_006070 [Ulmus minor]
MKWIILIENYWLVFRLWNKVKAGMACRTLHPESDVNGCTGKMGKAITTTADSTGISVAHVSFGSEEENGTNVDVCGKKIEVHGHSGRESILSTIFDGRPNLIVVDYTIPAAINANAELYSKVGVPFVMGTTGGDRDQLYKTVEDSKVYAVISPQMGKHVIVFLTKMEIMADQFPGAFSGYSLQVMESHQSSKVDASGTTNAVISCFQKLGVSFEMDQYYFKICLSLSVALVGRELYSFSRNICFCCCQCTRTTIFINSLLYFYPLQLAQQILLRVLQQGNEI